MQKLTLIVMKEKQFDHIDQRIKEAADNSYPAFNEESWAKMELLLDNNRKRRFAFWWYIIPVLLVTGIGALLIYRPIMHSNARQIAGVQTPTNSSDQKSPSIVAGIGAASSGSDEINSKTTNPDLINIKSGTTLPEADQTNSGNRAPNYRKVDDLRGSLQEDKIAEAPESNKFRTNLRSSFKTGGSVAVEDEQTGEVVIKTQVKPDQSDEHKPFGKNQAADSLKKTVEVAEQKITKVAADSAAVNQKSPKSAEKKSRFFITAITGYEVNSVKFMNVKNAGSALEYGGSLGYDVSTKVSVQAGFIASRKKYIAGPGDYNPKAGSYLSMVDIRKVEGNCIVYQVPVTVLYHLKNLHSLRPVLSAGISSYIMKREDYTYLYLRNNTYYQKTWTYTGNKNLFSLLTFSAYVEKDLKRGLSLSAGPSASIPLKGVGDGKVKLYTVAMQLGLKYQPLGKKVKRPIN